MPTTRRGKFLALARVLSPGQWLTQLVMYCRLANACHAKCLPPQYREGELNKGETVCLDRCATKFFEAQKLVGQAMQQTQQGMQAQGGGGGGLF